MGQTEWCKDTSLLHRFTWSCSVILLKYQNNKTVSRPAIPVYNAYVMALWTKYQCVRILLEGAGSKLYLAHFVVYLGRNFYLFQSLSLPRSIIQHRQKPDFFRGKLTAMKWDTFKDEYFVAVETGTNGHLWQTQATRFV